MSAHRESSKLATASLMEIISRGQALQAAVIRGAPPEEQEQIRQEMHDVLDAYLDHTAEAAQHALSLLG